MSKKKLNSKFIEYDIDCTLFKNKQILGNYLNCIKTTKNPIDCKIITINDNSNNISEFNSLFNVLDNEDVIGITLNIDLNKTLTVLFKFEEVWFDNQKIIKYIREKNENLVIISEQIPSWGSKSVLKYKDLLKTCINSYNHNLNIKQINLNNTSFIKENSITINNNDTIDHQNTDEENIDDQYTDEENIDDPDLDINNNSIGILMKNIFETQQKMFNNQVAQTSLIIQLLNNMKNNE